MTETVWIVLILAVAGVIIMIAFRKRLSEFYFDVKKRKGKMKTHAPGGVNISEIRMDGKSHEINVLHDNVNVRDIHQTGEGHKIKVKHEQ